MRVVIVVYRQIDLLQVIAARHAPRSFAGCLHGWKQQRDEHTNDGDHYEEFDKRESGPMWRPPEWRSESNERKRPVQNSMGKLHGTSRHRERRRPVADGWLRSQMMR